MIAIHHFKKKIICHIKMRRPFCQDIVHPLAFWCNLVLIFSFSFPIAPWQKVSGYARSSVSFCSFRSKKKQMTALEKKSIFNHPKRIVIIISKLISYSVSHKGEYSGSSYPIQNKIKLNQIWASYAHTLETRVSSWQRYAENSRSSNGQL